MITLAPSVTGRGRAVSGLSAEPTVLYLQSDPHVGPVPNRDRLAVIDEHQA